MRIANCWPASVLALVALLSCAHAGEHRYVGSAAIRNNPERGFRFSTIIQVLVLYQLTPVLFYRHEVHGACTGEGVPNGSARGIDPGAMKQMSEYNLTVAQV